MNKLIGLSYSPWTEKARWSLDYLKIPYRYQEHLLIFGMPQLWWQAKNFSSEITVPTFIPEQGKGIWDSFQIAKHLDHAGILFPLNQMNEITELNKLCEEALDAGRALLTYNILRNKEAQEAFLPDFIPEGFRGFFPFLAKIGVYYVQKEFQIEKSTEQEKRTKLENALQKLEKKISFNTPLFQHFSFADIAGSVALHLVKPPRSILLNRVQREFMTDETLCRKFSSFIDWRDRTYEKFR